MEISPAQQATSTVLHLNDNAPALSAADLMELHQLMASIPQVVSNTTSKVNQESIALQADNYVDRLAEAGWNHFFSDRDRIMKVPTHLASTYEIFKGSTLKEQLALISSALKAGYTLWCSNEPVPNIYAATLCALGLDTKAADVLAIVVYLTLKRLATSTGTTEHNEWQLHHGRYGWSSGHAHVLQEFLHCEISVAVLQEGHLVFKSLLLPELRSPEREKVYLIPQFHPAFMACCRMHTALAAQLNMAREDMSMLPVLDIMGCQGQDHPQLRPYLDILRSPSSTPTATRALPWTDEIAVSRHSTLTLSPDFHIPMSGLPLNNMYWEYLDSFTASNMSKEHKQRMRRITLHVLQDDRIAPDTTELAILEEILRRYRKPSASGYIILPDCSSEHTVEEHMQILEACLQSKQIRYDQDGHAQLTRKNGYREEEIESRGLRLTLPCVIPKYIPLGQQQPLRSAPSVTNLDSPNSLPTSAISTPTTCPPTPATDTSTTKKRTRSSTVAERRGFESILEGSRNQLGYNNPRFYLDTTRFRDQISSPPHCAQMLAYTDWLEQRMNSQRLNVSIDKLRLVYKRVLAVLPTLRGKHDADLPGLFYDGSISADTYDVYIAFRQYIEPRNCIAHFSHLKTWVLLSLQEFTTHLQFSSRFCQLFVEHIRFQILHGSKHDGIRHAINLKTAFERWYEFLSQQKELQPFYA